MKSLYSETLISVKASKVVVYKKMCSVSLFQN